MYKISFLSIFLDNLRALFVNPAFAFLIPQNFNMLIYYFTLEGFQLTYMIQDTHSDPHNR